MLKIQQKFNMQIGVIGLGVVGGVVFKSFKKLNNNCFGLDISNQHEKKKLLKQDIIYICLPTNFKKKKLNTRLISSYLEYLDKNSYPFTVAIKSTLNPGDTIYFQKKYKKLNKKICYVPEFLKERTAYKDFTKNHDLLIVGSNHKKSTEKIILNHGTLPKRKIILRPQEAELVKLFSNSYNALRVTFANSFYELCLSANSNYEKVLNSYLLRGLSSGNYLSCNKNLRGFGGKCLPKDLKCINYFIKSKKKNIHFFNDILRQNSKFKITCKK